MVLRVEDDVVLRPVLALLHPQVLRLERAAVREGLDLRLPAVGLGPDLHRDVVAAVLRQRQGVGEAGELGVVLHGRDASLDGDGLVDEPELDREGDGGIGHQARLAALHLEERVLHGEPFGEGRVVPEHAVGVADVEEAGDELEVQLGRDLLGLLEVGEVSLVHVPELGELRVRQEDFGVAGLRRAAPDLLGRLEVLVHQEVGGIVEPEVGLLGGALEQQRGQE